MSSDDSVHIADVEVHVEDALIKADISDGPDDGTILDLSFSLDSEAMANATAESQASLSTLSEDLPCFSVVSAQQDWFGSMCLSACKSTGEASFQCPVQLPSEGLTLSLR